MGHCKDCKYFNQTTNDSCFSEPNENIGVCMVTTCAHGYDNVKAKQAFINRTDVIISGSDSLFSEYGHSFAFVGINFGCIHFEDGKYNGEDEPMLKLSIKK